MKRVLFTAMALLVVAVGCKNRGNEVVTPSTTLEGAVTEITVSDKAQRVEIEVVCNEEFDVKEDVFWLTVANMLEPVVVKPETVSKIASTTFGIAPVRTNGTAPKMEIIIQQREQIINPSFA